MFRITFSFLLLISLKGFTNDFSTPICFKGALEKSVCYFKFLSGASKNLIISTGYSEPAIKYEEFIKDLGANFNIFIIEHRGQGNSERLGEGAYVTHVDKFENYVSDLKQFIEKEIKLDLKDKDTFLYAHSMGAAVAAHYLDESKVIKKAALNAPMFEIKLPLPKFIISKILELAVSLGYSKTAIWNPFNHKGQKELEKDRGTQSLKRFKRKLELRSKYPAIKISSLSYGWLLESIKANRPSVIKGLGKSLKVPVLLFNAPKDQLVRKEGQLAYCDQSKLCTLEVIQNAKHEIYIEKDDIRNAYLTKLNDFLR